MFRRNIISKLEAWKQDKKHKPLILRGARQVGKTTVVNEFGSQFDNYLYFNLERNEHAKLFEMELPLDDLVNMLYASVGKVKKEGTTLVFIDEIQNSPKTIALLRKKNLSDNLESFPSTYNLYQEGDSVIIDLLTIYDKGEISNISDEFISFLLDKRKNG